jgi:hypothetical protein
LKRTIASLLLAASLTACGSSYTILDTSTLVISENSKISAQTLLPSPEKYPAVVQKLGLAEEVYEQQLFLLKERRNKLRARRRYLNAFSFGTFTVTAVGVGVTAIQTDEADAPDNLQAAGIASLAGLALGTIFQVAGYMQEDVDAVDSKVEQLDGLHNEMIDKLRVLAQQANGIGAAAAAPGAAAPAAPAIDLQFEMSRVIQEFINRAKLINVKG